VTAVLVDSDILIELLRRRDSAILAAWRELVESDALVACSPVTVAEIWGGVRKGEEAAVTAMFAAMVHLPIDEAAGQLAGEYLRKYRPSHGVEIGDALIAASAAVHRCRLWTRNRKHFPMRDVELY
jgi:predicted nucleic acid-binding protein